MGQVETIEIGNDNINSIDINNDKRSNEGRRTRRSGRSKYDILHLNGLENGTSDEERLEIGVTNDVMEQPYLDFIQWSPKSDRLVSPRDFTCFFSILLFLYIIYSSKRCTKEACFEIVTITRR
ncbi:unnamed protein product [Trichobilharzia regenti]|nr:unnamed protein product [Trichobilharzia regenti]